MLDKSTFFNRDTLETFKTAFLSGSLDRDEWLDYLVRYTVYLGGSVDSLRLPEKDGNLGTVH